MLIKEHPEDFRVEEHIDLVWCETPGPFCLYRMEKRSWNTVDALQAAALATHVPWHVIRYGGKKDRHACTVQYCTTPASFDLSFQRHNVSVIRVGFTQEPMAPRHIVFNKFGAVLRGVEPDREDLLCRRWEDLVRYGEMNYFDDQRFGGVEAEGTFFAEFLVRKDFSSALRCFMTAHHPDAAPSLRRRKASIGKFWGNWKALRPLCVSPEEREMVNCCLAKPGEEGILDALGKISREAWGLFLASFQSAIWNEALVSLVQSRGEATWSLEGKIAPLWFFHHKGPEGCWKNLLIPMPSRDIPQDEGEGGRILRETLDKKHLRPGDFLVEALPQVHFASFLRPAVVRPQEASLSFADDDRHPGYRKAEVSFLLPAGSYATLLLQTLKFFPGACAKDK